jgi:hypothetical protein
MNAKIVTGFRIRTKDSQLINFSFYFEAAPLTSQAFFDILPFTKTFLHARQSGQEIWTANGPELDIIQENASVFAETGEIVAGPIKPLRAKTSNCLGIYYGEGKGIDSCNIFGKVHSEDLDKLRKLGDDIWRYGEQELIFEKTE